ncbi:hypothetical protein B4Q13_20885, partial [Lacticaseibacillus rhamnosus]
CVGYDDVNYCALYKYIFNKRIAFKSNGNCVSDLLVLSGARQESTDPFLRPPSMLQPHTAVFAGVAPGEYTLCVARPLRSDQPAHLLDSMGQRNAHIPRAAISILMPRVPPCHGENPTR